MSAIGDFVRSCSGFYNKTAVDQLLALAWFVEARQQRPNFDGAYLRSCFRDAGLDAPDMSVYLPRLASKKPPQLIKERGGYKLAGHIRRDLDKSLGGDQTVIAVVNTLVELPGKISDSAEREFLSEALGCYRVRAFRAAIIMTWILAYDHLVSWVLNDATRTQSLNAGLTSKFPRKNMTVTRHEDVEALKEFEFIEAARAANLLDKNTNQILKEKLARRNMAAHPSKVVITQHQADDMITDLVSNVILKLH